MLKKLLGYDLANIFKVISIFYCLSLVFGVLTRFFSNTSNTLVISIIGEICLGAAISMLCSTLINNIMRIWVRFKNNLYGDQSYLTHTLPVTKTTHYLSKILTIVITLFVSFAVVGAVLFIMFYSKDNIEMIKGLLFPIANTYDRSILGLLTVVLFVLFLEFLNILQCGFTGIILGNRMNNAKLGFSVLYGFITYILSQAIVLLLTYVIALYNSDLMGIFVTNTVVDISALKIAISVAIIGYTLVSVFLCFVNIKLLNKGVDVD